MKRAERAERLINSFKRQYEADHNSLPDHWVDLTQTVASGCQSSELNVPATCRDDLLDNTKDDVELGIKLGRMMKDGEECFSATITDADNRDLHFFFIATSENVVVERLLAAFQGVRS